MVDVGIGGCGKVTVGGKDQNEKRILNNKYENMMIRKIFEE